jgi:hypothetical protein
MEPFDKTDGWTTHVKRNDDATMVGERKRGRGDEEMSAKA